MEQISSKKRNRILDLVDEDKIFLSEHAIEDCMKQGYRWTKTDLKRYIRKSRMFEGKNLYPKDKKLWNRVYSMARLNPITRKLILMALLVREDLIIIHCSPCNSGSREGKIYYSSE